MKRALVLLTALCGLMVVPSVAAVPFPAAAAAAETEEAFAEIAGCIAGADNLLVSVVVDESLSLRETDPTALRVRGITSAVDSLEQLARVTPEVNVEVSLSTFARTFTTLLDWQPLNLRSAQQLRDTAVAELPKRDAGDATDYRQALLGARNALETRSRQLNDDAACKVVLWFTDGALDVDSATDQAATEICQPGGIADSVRNAGINVIALALLTPGSRVSDAQRDQLQAVAEGRGNAATCGTIPLPSDSAHGVYLPADDPASLQLLFAGAGALVAGGTSAGAISCPSTDCPNGRYELRIDPGTAGLRIIVQGSGVLQIEGPDGRQVRVSDGLSFDVSGVQVEALQRDSLTTIDLTFPRLEREPQIWTLTPAGAAIIDTYWFWGAEVAATTGAITAGTNNVVGFQIQDESGVAIPTSLYGDLRASVTADGRALPTTVSDRGLIEAKFPLGTDDVPSAVVFAAEITARTQPSGVPLGPIRSVSRVTVRLPPAFPTVAPESVDFGSLEGAGSRDAELRITGSDLGDTKVCLENSTFRVPGEGSPVSVTSDDPCVTVPQAGKRALGLTLSPGVSADGVAEGNIQLQVTSADGERVRLTIPGSLDMARPVDQNKRGLLIAALIIMALLIPVLLIIASNIFLLGRFLMSSGTRIASVPITIGPEGLSRDNGTALVEPDDLHNAPFSGTKRARRMDVAGTTISLRAVRLLSLRAPRGVAAGRGTRKLVSGFGSREGSGPTEAPVGLGSVDAAFVSIDNPTADDQATGRLIVVIPPGVDVMGANDRARRVAHDVDWRKILAELAVTPTPVSPAVTPADMRRSGDATSVSAPSNPGGASSDAPGVPSWLSDDSAPTTPPATPAPSTRRQSRRAQPPPPASPRRDDLPPLPDFLRDKD